MHDPKVSICVPSYNHVRFLPMALDSALAQTCDDFEVVVVDDGSTDGSLAVAQSYAARHPSKVRVFTHPGHSNRGVSETVNLAFEKARGQFLCGLPSDDLIYPDKLERQLEVLDNRPEIGWVYSSADIVDEEGRKIAGSALFGEDITREADPLKSLIHRNVIPGMTALMRRSLVERVGPHDPALVYSDWEFWVRMLARGPVAFLERPTVMYRVHGYNTSVNVETRVNVGRGLEVMRSLRRKASATGGGLALARTQAWLDMEIAYHLFCLGRGEEDEAKQSLAAMFETDPALLKDASEVLRWVEVLTFQPLYAVPEAAAGGFARWVARNLPRAAGGTVARRVAATGFAHAVKENSYGGDWRAARRVVLNCLLRDPSWLGDPSIRYGLRVSLFGPRPLGVARRLKRAVVRPKITRGA